MKNYSTVFNIILISCLCISTAVVGQERRSTPEYHEYGFPATATDQLKIDSLIKSYQLSWASQNVELLMSLHADDTEWTNAYARIFQTKESLTKFVSERLFPMFDPTTSQLEMNRSKIVSRRYLGDDAAIVHFYTESNRGGSRNSDEHFRRIHFHLVLEKQDQQWTIAHTAIMDAR